MSENILHIMGGASSTNAVAYRKPTDAKYIQSIDFVAAWTKNGIKEQNPDALIPEDLNKWGGGKYIVPYFKYTDNPEDAVKDIKVISYFMKQDETPEGYIKVSQDLNQGSGGKYIYICYSKSNGEYKFTDISFYHKHLSNVKEEEVQGWKILRDEKGNKIDLNEGAGGVYANVLYKVA